MMYALRSREAVKQGRNQIFVDENIFPHTLDVLLTRSEPFGIEIIRDDFASYEFTGKEFGAIVQYPAANGEVRDYAAFTAKAHEAGITVTAVAEGKASSVSEVFVYERNLDAVGQILYDADSTRTESLIHAGDLTNRQEILTEHHNATDTGLLTK